MRLAGTIPVLERAIGVVESIAANERMTTKRLAEELEIPSATCYRILRTLARANWIREVGRGEFQLASGLARVARGFASIEQVMALWKNPLQALAFETGLSVKVSIREGMEAVTLLRTEAVRANAISSPVGSRLHLLEAGSAGVVLMSELESAELERLFQKLPEGYWEHHSRQTIRREISRAAREGFARAFGTVNPAIYAASAAVRIPDGPLAAVTVVGWRADFENGGSSGIEKALRAAARHLQELPEPLARTAA